jgi:outer membrane protein assembly factor BamB
MLPDSVIATPIAIGNSLVVAVDSGILYALNKQNGQEIWEYNTQDDINTPIAASREYIIVGTGGPFTIDDTSILFIDYRTGKLVKKLALSKLPGFPGVHGTFTQTGLVVLKDRILLGAEATIMCLGN